MKIKTILLALLIVLLFSPSLLFAQNEQITITTYYPSPNGVYNQLAANKFVVDIANMGEYGSMQNGDALIGRSVTVGVEGAGSEHAAMQQGDAHIWRSMIIGSGQGSGFAYDEAATTDDGYLLVKSRLGIATNNPLAPFHLMSPDSDLDVKISNDILPIDDTMFDGMFITSTGNLAGIGTLDSGGAGIGLASNGASGGIIISALPDDKIRFRTYSSATDINFELNCQTGQCPTHIITMKGDTGTVGIGTDDPVLQTGATIPAPVRLHVAGGHIHIDEGYGIGDANTLSGMVPNGNGLSGEPAGSLALVVNNGWGMIIDPSWNTGFNTNAPLNDPSVPATPVPNGVNTGNLDVNDVWLRGANCSTGTCLGAWASEISGSCQRYRSEVWGVGRDKSDAVFYCPDDRPVLYSCQAQDDQSPPDVPTPTPCEEGGYCCETTGLCDGTGIRRDPGEDMLFHETVVNSNNIQGCWAYDNEHAHTDYRLEIMCCKN